MTAHIPRFPARPAGIALAAAAMVLGAAGAASAHVEIVPGAVARGEGTELTIRVPTERDIPTVAVAVDVPPQMIVYGIENPPPGFTVSERLAADGRLAGITWRGRIPIRRYQDFTLLATPLEEGTATWKTRQTYADGKVKPWTGPPEPEDQAAPESGPTEPGPAPVVEITAEGDAAPVASDAASTDEDDSGAAIWLGLIGIALAVAALVGVGLLWSTRPITLPEDESP
jgi:hypothetical protein